MNESTSNSPIPDFLSKKVKETKLFFLDIATPASTNPGVVCGGREHCRADYEVNRPDFPHYCVEFVSSGCATLKLGDRRPTVIDAGSLFIYGPEVPHSIVADSNEPPVKYFVDVAGENCELLFETFGLKPGVLCHTSNLRVVRQVFEDLIRNGQSRSVWRQRACDCIFELLLIEIVRSSIPHGSRQSGAYQTYQRCRDLIQERFLTLRSLGDIARACHVDGAYICRLFKRFGDISPYDYLVQLRMEYAAELLRDSGVMVKMVAAEMGFANPYHFSRVFKRVHGFSPERLARLVQRE